MTQWIENQTSYSQAAIYNSFLSQFFWTQPLIFYIFVYAKTNYPFHLALRWQPNISLGYPIKSITIDSVELRVTAHNDYTTGLSSTELRVYDGSAPDLRFNALHNGPFCLPSGETKNFVITYPIPAFSQNTEYNLADLDYDPDGDHPTIEQLVQCWIDRDDYQSDDSIGFSLIPTTTHQRGIYDGQSGPASRTPELEINYTLAYAYDRPLINLNLPIRDLDVNLENRDLALGLKSRSNIVNLHERDFALNLPNRSLELEVLP